jgi:hypothetical protein
MNQDEETDSPGRSSTLNTPGSQFDDLTGLQKTVQLSELIRNRLDSKSNLEERVQDELWRWLVILPSLDNEDNKHLLPTAEVAVRGLLHDSPRLRLAAKMRATVQRQVKLNKFYAFHRTRSPAFHVLFGLAVYIFLSLALGLYFVPLAFSSEKVLGFDPHMLFLVSLSGTLGSIASILVRIKDFMTLKNPHPTLLFLQGLFLPVLGGAFSVFVYAAINSGIIPVKVDDPDPAKVRFFYGTVSFLSGFSERFASHFLEHAEENVSGRKQPKGNNKE